MDWSRLLAHALERQHESHNLIDRSNKGKGRVGLLWSGFRGGLFLGLVLG